MAKLRGVAPTLVARSRPSAARLCVSRGWRVGPPVVTAEVDEETQLVDGRNRRAACKIAGVVPTSRDLNGEDPAAFVISANIHRRHLTKGQRAMAVAMIYPKAHPGKKTSSVSEEAKVSAVYLSQARTVLEYTPDLPANVVLGTTSLDAAYEKARARKLVATGEAARVSHLRKSYPALADKVVEGDLTLPGARAEAVES